LQVIGPAAVQSLLLIDQLVVGLIKGDLEHPRLGLAQHLFRNSRIGWREDRPAPRLCILAAHQVMNGEGRTPCPPIPTTAISTPLTAVKIRPALAVHKHHRGRARKIDFVIAPEVRQDALNVERIAGPFSITLKLLLMMVSVPMDSTTRRCRSAPPRYNAHEPAVEAVLEPDGAHLAGF